MEYVYSVLEPNRIDGTIGIAFEALHDFQDTGTAEAFQRLALSCFTSHWAK